MNSNKNMIPIDELFGQLKNHKESMPANAWDNMEHILNQKMPLGSAANKRNYLNYLLPIVGVLLISTAGFLWYSQSQSNPNTKNTIKKNSFVIQHTNLDANSQQPSNTITDSSTFASSTKTTHANSFNNDFKQNSNSSSVKNHSLSGRSKVNSNHSEVFLASNESAIPKTIVDATSSTVPVLMQVDDYSKDKSLANSDIAAESFSIEKEKHFTLQYLESHQPVQFPIPTKELPVIEVQKVTKVIKGNFSSGNYNEEANQINDQFQPAVKKDGETIVRNMEGQLYKEEKKDINRVEIVKREVNTSTTKTYALDTISIVTIQKIKYTPLTAFETKEVNQLLAASYSGNRLKEHYIPLENFKVKSKEIRSISKVKNIAQEINQYFDGSNNLYLALLVGGNASMGINSGYGMHIGAGAYYKLSERWTVGTEFRFLNRFFPAFQFTDQNNQFDVERQPASNGWLYTGQEKIGTNSYSVKNLQDLALPIILNYSIHERLSVIAGLNFSYHLPVKYQKKYSESIRKISEYRVNGEESAFENKPFSVNESTAFVSRMGIGYVTGLNYEISKKLSLDARVTQNLWNSGPKAPNSLYQSFKKPVFELSLGFYLGRRDKVVYIMDRN